MALAAAVTFFHYTFRSTKLSAINIMVLLFQVCKVYIGSFNADKPIRTDMNPSGEELFNKEQSDLLQDLFEIPQRSCDRKVRGNAAQCIATLLPLLSLTGHKRTDISS